MAFPKDTKQFEQAVKEARDLVRDMTEGIYKDIEDPKEVFLKAISNRPEGYVRVFCGYRHCCLVVRKKLMY